MGISKRILLNSMEFSPIFAQLHINKLIKLHKLVKLPDIPSFLSWLSLGYRVKVTARLIRILTAGLSAAAEPLQSLVVTLQIELCVSHQISHNLHVRVG